MDDLDEYLRSYGANRVVCNVLEEMRACVKTANYSYLPGLIEEVQTMVNRMEAALGDAQDVRNMQEERAKLKQEIKELRKEVKASRTIATEEPVSGAV